MSKIQYSKEITRGLDFEMDAVNGRLRGHTPGPFRSRSISRDLAVSLVILLLLFEGVGLLALYNHQASYIHQQIQTKADEYLLSLSETLAVPVWDYDGKQIRKIGEGFARNDTIDAIEILSADGEVMFRFDRSSGMGREIERVSGINHEGHEIGQVRLWLSLGTYRHDLIWLRNTLFVILGISLVVIVVMTDALLRILMRKPLAILQNGIDRVAQGDYEYRLDGVRHKELAGIASRFSEMAIEIRDREQSLQEEVSERKKAEDTLRDRETQLRAILDAIPDMMFQLERDGRFVNMRGDARKLFKKPESFTRRMIEDIMPSPIDLIFRQHLTDAFNSRQLQVFEFELPLASQKAFYECRLMAITDDRAFALVRDITQNVTAAAEKNRLMEQLQRAQKMEAIGMLAGGVAHDLNNVLSGIVSYPELLLLNMPESSPLRQPLQVIQKSGEKAANIVQDLLTLARRGVSVSEVVNLNTIIMDYLQSAELEKLRLYNPGIELKLELESSLLNISGSPVHLSKTVMNLVSNAAEAMAKGGQIILRTENRYIDKPVKGYVDIQEGDYVVFQVSDAGIGISEEDIHRIFEPFYTKKVMGRSGTGLGMAVVWGTVTDHKGYIDVQSAPDKGTSISIYIPATRDPQAGSATHPSRGFPGRGEHILVVDDVAEQREIAAAMLLSLGYEVECVASGEEALSILTAHPVDLVLLDMIMDPGIDGLETYRRILSIRPDQRAVITSGFSESVRVREAQSLGAGPYVRKPYRMQTISQVIREELDR